MQHRGRTRWRLADLWRQGVRVGLALGLGVVLPAAAQAPPASAPDHALAVTEFELGNGMRFVIVERPSMPTVEAGWVVSVGSRHEGPDESGRSHLLEHMLFKGSRTIGTRDPITEAALFDQIEAIEGQVAALRGKTGGRSERKRSELTEQLANLEAAAARHVDLGAFSLEYSRAGATRLNANTAEDLTLYYVTVPAEKVELWFWMESDRLRDPVFRELPKEKQVIAEERGLRIQSVPTGAADLALHEAFWRDTPYAGSTLGTPQGVEGATRAGLAHYFERHYRPDRLTAVLVGNIDPDQARRLAESYFGRWLVGGDIDDAPDAPLLIANPSPKALAVECACPEQVKIRYPTVGLGHQDQTALQALSGVLNGRGGRLYRELVLERELAFAAFTRQVPLARAGFFEVTLEPKQGNSPEALVAAWDQQIRRLVATGVPLAEWTRTRRRLATEHLNRLKDPHQLMRRLLVYSGLGDWRRLTSWPEDLQQLDPVALQSTAERHLRPEARLIAIYERMDEGTP